MPKEKVALCSPPTATSHVIERLPRRFSRTDTAKSGTWRAYLEQVYGARSAGGAALTDLRSFTWFYHGSPLGTVEPARLGPRCEPLRGHAWVPEIRPLARVAARARARGLLRAAQPPAPFPNGSFAEVMRVSWPHAAGGTAPSTGWRGRALAGRRPHLRRRGGLWRAVLVPAATSRGRAATTRSSSRRPRRTPLADAQRAIRDRRSARRRAGGAARAAITAPAGRIDCRARATELPASSTAATARRHFSLAHVS